MFRPFRKLPRSSTGRNQFAVSIIRSFLERRASFLRRSTSQSTISVCSFSARKFAGIERNRYGGGGQSIIGVLSNVEGIPRNAPTIYTRIYIYINYYRRRRRRTLFNNAFAIHFRRTENVVTPKYRFTDQHHDFSA